jgi:hypothetical protein
MARKSKLDTLKQLDIIAAMKGNEVFVEEEKEEILTESKSLSPFDFINDIRKFKTGTLLDKEQNLSSFESFMIIKGLSMKLSDVPVLNFANKYSSVLDKKQMYMLLSCIIEKDSTFYRWIKTENGELNDYTDYVAKYFECSKNEAHDYIKILGDEFGKEIKNKFGDFKQ